MKRILRTVLAVLLWVASLSFSPSGQSLTRADGHWEGSIDINSKKLEVLIDLAHKPDASWIATIDIPDRGLKGYPLADLVVEGDRVSFAMRDLRGAPLFKGALIENGAAISGDFIQAGRAFHFRLERRGKANVQQGEYGETPDKGVAGPSLVGVWQGSLDSTYLLRELSPAAADSDTGARLRIILKVTQANNGGYSARLDSPDQSVAGLPAEILLDGQSVTFEQRKTHSSFAGRMTQDRSEIEGEWTNGEWTLPLTLKRLNKKN